MSDFEKWWASKPFNIRSQLIARQAYEAGRKAGLTEAAEIAVATGSLGCSDVGFDMADRIADAIRERMK